MLIGSTSYFYEQRGLEGKKLEEIYIHIELRFFKYIN